MCVYVSVCKCACVWFRHFTHTDPQAPSLGADSTLFYRELHWDERLEWLLKDTGLWNLHRSLRLPSSPGCTLRHLPSSAENKENTSDMSSGMKLLGDTRGHPKGRGIPTWDIYYTLPTQTTFFQHFSVLSQGWYAWVPFTCTCVHSWAGSGMLSHERPWASLHSSVLVMGH